MTAALASGFAFARPVSGMLAVMAHDRGGGFQANADGTALIDEGALCGDPPDDVLRCQYRRHRHHLAWTLFGVLGPLLTR
jgi:hypothetical protein